MAPGYDKPVTDYTRWRLKADHGRQTWHYLNEEEAKEWPQTTADKYFLGLDTEQPTLPTPKTPLDIATNGVEFFSKLQLEPGEWACEYGGPMFLLPGLVIAWYVTDTPISQPTRDEMIRYLCNRAHPVDGGWSIHTEGESTVFGTACNYTAIRLLGMDADHPVAVKARNILWKMGGALGSPHWGKFWLAMLGCYEWEGMNPIPPEMWLLPDIVPLAPWRWWIHTRAVYLPMSFMYSRKFTKPLTALTKSLRQELYPQGYESISWSKSRNIVNPDDIYHPHHPILDLFNTACTFWGNWILPSKLKTWAEDHVYSLVVKEDENTDYVNLGPVNNPLQMIVRYIKDGPDSCAVRRHQERLQDYLWVDAEGMLMNGTNGVQVWDICFTTQAIVDAGLAEDLKWRPMLTKCLEFLEDHQMTEDLPPGCYRQRTKGAWPFSTKAQGYTVSDCTAESIKSTLLLQALPGMPQLISLSRLRDGIDTLLTMQNTGGGFASYETIRGPEILEWFNAAEVFGRIMIEYNYPECTTAVVTALVHFSEHDPEYRAGEIQRTINRAVKWIESNQAADGSWYGSWGICYTYAAMFALESLSLVGQHYPTSPRVVKAVEFILSKQMVDGGWGESFKSCVENRYVHHETSQVVATCWALIALMHGGYGEGGEKEKEVLTRGLRIIKARQLKDGSWPQEAIEGVFNKNCMITYPNYKFYFPIKALGMYAKRFGNKEI